MRAYYGSRISENQTRTPEGFLICLNVPIARTGVQQYLPSELDMHDAEPGTLVDVFRTEDEVFADATLASFEGKPVTDDHPPVSLTTENICAYDCGHAQNVRRGKGNESDLLIADLFITSPRLIEDIKNGRREVSCGYDCEYVQDESGRIFQQSIRGNHVAVVPAGRAGSRVAIKDSAESNSDHKERGKKHMAKTTNPSFIARIFSRAVKDMEPEEVAQAVDEMQNEIAASADTTPAVPAPKDSSGGAPKIEDGDPAAAIIAAINALGQTITQTLSQKIDSALAAKPADSTPTPPPADVDPLEQLADEIAKAAPETPADQEAAVTVSPEQIPSDEDTTEETSDEDGPVAAASLLPQNPIPGADRAIAMAAINAVKPVIAALPEGQRKAASDRAASEIRKMIGKDSKASNNGYSAIMGVMQQKAKAKDSKAKAKVDDGAIGRNIMASRNPHYKKS